MRGNVVICGNKGCPNYDGKGCDKSFITLNRAGKCVSSEQKREDEKNAELAGNYTGK